ncbi:MAG: DUF2141 domain-containing protein [Deltaproteobacteria bacterium]|nr:DUF2141 domain-containing protein [Deltaproteobacteria bacterium]
MIQRIVLLSLSASLAVAMSASSDEPGATGTEVGKLTVVPVGLEKNEGSVMIRLASGEADFESDGRAFRSAIVKVENKQAVAVFEDVPHGEYAIKIFHDENENEKLDTNFLGVPKQKFGFSNDALGRFGPPSYEQARFRFEATEATIEIEMH